MVIPYCGITLYHTIIIITNSEPLQFCVIESLYKPGEKDTSQFIVNILRVKCSRKSKLSTTNARCLKGRASSALYIVHVIHDNDYHV